MNVTTTVTNNGPDNASGIKITYKIPNGLEWVSDDSNGSYNRTTGIWDIGNLSVNSSRVLNIKTKVIGSGIIQNYVEKTAENENDSVLDNDSSANRDLCKENVDIRVSNYPWYATTVNGTKIYLDKYAYSNTPIFTVDVRNVGGVDGVNYDDCYWCSCAVCYW